MIAKLATYKQIKYLATSSMRESTGGRAGGPNPLENHNAIEFLSNTGTNLLGNPEDTKPAFIQCGPTSGKQQNAIQICVSLVS